MSLHNQHSRTREDYRRLRASYVPLIGNRKVIFIFESPPYTGKYFYNPDYNPKGQYDEPVYRAMMKDVLQLQTKPQSKKAGLDEFKAGGYLLLDATYTPVNYPRAHPSYLSKAKRKARILVDYPDLKKELHDYVEPRTKVILVKENICKFFDQDLTRLGFNVVNRGLQINFPGCQRNDNFSQAVRQLLG